MLSKSSILSRSVFSIAQTIFWPAGIAELVEGPGVGTAKLGTIARPFTATPSSATDLTMPELEIR